MALLCVNDEDDTEERHRALRRERSTTANGNGRVAAISAPLAPVRRYRVEPPRRRGVGRILLVAVAWLFVAVLVVAAGLAGGAYLYLEEGVAQALTPRDAQVIAASETLDAVPRASPRSRSRSATTGAWAPRAR